MIYSLNRDTEIVDKFVHGGLAIAEIARRIGVSSVRAGQILRELGVDTQRVLRDRSRQRLLQETAQRQAEKAERQRARAERIKAAAEVRYASWLSEWDDGLPVKVIAAMHGLSPNTVAWTTTQLHKRYGWFPRRIKRKKNHLVAA